jgi:uncharacterized RDD family membrane protein YckC
VGKGWPLHGQDHATIGAARKNEAAAMMDIALFVKTQEFAFIFFRGRKLLHGSLSMWTFVLKETVSEWQDTVLERSSFRVLFRWGVENQQLRS